MSERTWGFGDRLVHADRPEWGVGVVASANPATQDGKPCQRLAIRFDRVGLKTLSTAFADLRPADAQPVIDQAEAKHGNGWLSEADAMDPKEILVRLPDDATDPFQTAEERVRVTLSLYRFDETGGSLIDWAASQTGLKDPLSRFSRHELEQYFDRFRRLLDDHLAKQVRELFRRNPAAVAGLAAKAPPAGQQALRRLHSRR